ncbi:carbon-nitrogen hydrolase family protein [candidate division KSB1 bacterium]|nr:carbon-nitrogen hydrolase family protein [candidate division KSB1 bacterium]
MCACQRFFRALFVFLLLSIKSYGQLEWTFQSPRAEIAPTHWIDKEILYECETTLALSGDNKRYAHGWWATTLPIKPGTSYEFKTHYLARDIAEAHRSILARLLWLDEAGEIIGRAEYPRTLENGLDWQIIQQTYRSPVDAKQAKLELVYRWDADGQVYFGATSFEETTDPPARLVKIATIHYRPQNSTPMKNLDLFKTCVERAGEAGADIVCLPEGITIVGTGKNYLEVSEPVPGPTTRYLSDLAQKHNMYIVAGLYEKEGPVLYNTAVLIDRTGALFGTYRKVCLPREEIQGGITPGEEFPVFDTDFGRIGLMICWDLAFPEPARVLALKGAEVIFMPIWGGNVILAQARAIENQIYLVSSTYDMKTGVYNREGELVVEGTEANPVALIEIDLNERTLWPWLGDYRNRIPRELPPEKSVQR